MSDKFTIKFKGILDHAATKKAIEQDISKMEKYLKPKKSSLGSTKDIVKNNLSDKKKELSRQSKFESLRERVEKYRLTQTKKLMKQGMGFEKARKEAFKRSLMSDRDKRRLEYKELAKESKAKSKMLAASQGKGLVAKIAIGSALGNVIGNAVSRVGGGIFGFAFGWIKKSVEAISKKEKAQKLSTAFYSTRQRKILMGDEEEKIKGIFQGKKGFERDLEKEELLRHFTLVKGTLTEMDKLNETNLINTGNFMAELVSSGQASMQEAAAAIDDYLRGNGDMLYKIMVGTKIGWKYKQAAKDNFQKAAMYKDFGFRLTELQKVAADFQSFKLTEFAGEKEKIDSNLINLEQSLMDVTAAGMQPVLQGASEVIEWVKSLINTYNKEGFTGLISNIVSAIIDPILQPFKDLYNYIVNSSFVKKILYFLGLG
ncbi:conserved hypothetical protein (plasmid) [Borreliella bissettiae DN127]|uniref:Uncharacterized protein n=1 Tax=Borrelia bissettiae (strain DSM 17990 / CIP 109136 / DN127) TaxID=521010 RepID=G0ANE6_BORBD|nr:DUF759 family protein [Borreliella bissettiae]AEL19222.1 conserved hypothetical protein [Borreliella bissettiae DN127]